MPVYYQIVTVITPKGWWFAYILLKNHSLNLHIVSKMRKSTLNSC